MARSIAAPGPRRTARRSARPAFGALRPLARAADLIRAGTTFAWRRRRLRIALLAVAIALPLLGGGWLWLRDSPLAAVQQVRISGVRGPEAASVDAALSGAARRMSTLAVNVGALRAAVARFSVVRDLSVSASFPHELRIHVSEQLPVAVLTVGGARTAVAADGVALGPALLSASLPAVAAPGSPPPPSGEIRDATVRGELRVLGAAPRVLLGWIARVTESHEGLTVAMRDGLLIYFGDATRPHAKWLSAARVLADPSSAGAGYIDVRAPERPAAGTSAAGGLEGSASSAGQVSASDPTAAALANALAEAVSGVPGSSGAGAAASASQLASQPATEAASQPAAQPAPASEAGTSGSHEQAQTAPLQAPSAGTQEQAPTPQPTPTEEHSASTSG
jgi:cell division protein FtsQ